MSMTATGIFIPVGLLVLWTLVILLVVGLMRLRAVRQREMSLGFYELYRDGEEPARLAVLGRHFHNLLEIPVLFYLAAITAYAIGAADEMMVWLAWGFLASRLLHSAIHLTRNDVRQRFTVFLLGVILLAVMWVRILMHLLG